MANLGMKFCNFFIAAAAVIVILLLACPLIEARPPLPSASQHNQAPSTQIATEKPIIFVGDGPCPSGYKRRASKDKHCRKIYG
ncbi:hypothetical protein C0J52_03271 [Blattella germanica]|nr:hypothetical protein C0J52_03271 [Blattella germanica]